MNINDIMNIDVENLKETQFKALKHHVLTKLKEIYSLIDENLFDEVEERLGDSPAGDGYGCDNQFIDFSYTDRSMDIGEMIEKLKYLSK